MTQYFKLTPIDQKPEKEGWYWIKFKYLNDEIYDKNLYSERLGWVENMDESAQWLQPLPSSSLVIEEEKLREILKEAINIGTIYGDSQPLAYNTINQLIADLKEQQG